MLSLSKHWALINTAQCARLCPRLAAPQTYIAERSTVCGEALTFNHDSFDKNFMNLKDKNKIISILLIVLSFALIIFLYKYNLKDNQSTSNLIAIIFVQFICAVMGLTLFIATTNEILKTQKNEIKRYGVRKYLAHITITILNSAYNICVTAAAIVYGAVSIFYSY